MQPRAPSCSSTAKRQHGDKGRRRGSGLTGAVSRCREACRTQTAAVKGNIRFSHPEDEEGKEATSNARKGKKFPSSSLLSSLTEKAHTPRPTQCGSPELLPSAASSKTPHRQGSGRARPENGDGRGAPRPTPAAGGSTCRFPAPLAAGPALRSLGKPLTSLTERNSSSGKTRCRSKKCAILVVKSYSAILATRRKRERRGPAAREDAGGGRGSYGLCACAAPVHAHSAPLGPVRRGCGGVRLSSDVTGAECGCRG